MKSRGVPLKRQLITLFALLSGIPPLLISLYFTVALRQAFPEGIPGAASRGILLGFIFSVAWAAVSIVISLVVSNHLANPLLHLGRVIQRISSGDMTDRVEMKSTTRELNALSETFDRDLIDPFNAILWSIKDPISRSGGVSEASSMYVEQTIVSISQINTRIASIKERLGRLDASIATASESVDGILKGIRKQGSHIASQTSAVSQTSAAIEEMSASIDSVARIAQEKRRGADNLVGITNAGEEKIDMAAKVITETADGIDQILGMISVINAVAAQTNLLAMNAAIEAAHAGEFGRGFAVVATEIRRLAESTASNAKKITADLKGYVKTINTASEASEAARRSFSRVKDEVHIFVDAFGEISASTSELAAGTSEIVKGMESLLGVSREIDAGSSGMTRGAEEIDTTLRSLGEFSRETVQNMEDVVISAQSVTWAQNEISRLSIENNRNLEELQKRMGTFRLSNEEKGHGENGLSISSAILMHQNWSVRLRMFMDGIADIDKRIISDHTACDFGNWYLSSGRERYGDDPDFSRIGELHESVHGIADKICELKTGGSQSDEIERVYSGLVEKSRQIVSLLTGIKQRAAEAAGGMKAADSRVSADAGSPDSDETLQELTEEDEDEETGITVRGGKE